MGLYSRSFSRKKSNGSISIETARLSGGAGVFFSRCSFDRPREHGRDLLTRPACGRPNARTRRLNHPRHVVILHVPSRRRRARGDYATSRPSTGARGTNAKRVRCADAPTRQHGSAESSSPERSPRRDRHRARDRRSAAAGRAGLPLPLCVCLPSLGRSTTRSTVSSSGTRSARAALLGHHSGRRGGGSRGNILTKNHSAGVPGG